ncbi:hypothetical protein P7K49_024740 [Saguinus oedipus]|uniref:Uncharacterized protein n=1 Tax=Saguinus oedipus TaxID=9490 RepID=A0ABQ9UQC9_SAGOE|nr:hypothetical protein P7K49_024740 [Saguinus oedipus]
MLQAGWMGHSDGIVTSSFWSLPAKKYKKVTGKEIYSDTLESTPMLEKEKFPQDYFPERAGQKRHRTHNFHCALLLAKLPVVTSDNLFLGIPIPVVGLGRLTSGQ